MLDLKIFTNGNFATNTYLLILTSNQTKANKVLIIDPATSEVKDLVDEMNLEPVMIINTHGHLDHIAGNLFFDQVPIFIHKDDASMLTDPELNLSAVFGEEVISPLPARMLEDGDVIDFEGINITVIHTPGHTPGSISLKIGNVLFSGDTLFSGSVGRTDLRGGDYQQLRLSLKRLMSLPDEIAVYPGHGEPTTIGKERISNPYLCNIC